MYTPFEPQERMRRNRNCPDHILKAMGTAVVALLGSPQTKADQATEAA
jgi:hypothetical protein